MADSAASRKNVVVLAALVACFAGLTPILMRNHHRLGLAWIAILAAALVFVIAQFAKVKRSER